MTDNVRLLENESIAITSYVLNVKKTILGSAAGLVSSVSSATGLLVSGISMALRSMQFSFQGKFSVRWHFASTQLKCSDQKLTEGMAERRKTESPPDEKSWGVVSGSNLGQTQSHQAWNQVDWYSILQAFLGLWVYSQD